LQEERQNDSLDYYLAKTYPISTPLWEQNIQMASQQSAPKTFGEKVSLALEKLYFDLQRYELKILAPLIINHFHRLWYNSPHTWPQNYYFGHQISQLPLDMFLYQELVYKERPAFILQTGVCNGGSVLYFAHLLDLIQADPSAIVIGIDIELTQQARALTHPRIHLIEGSSTDSKTIAAVEKLLPSQYGLVSLDSAHEYDHVLAELKLYQRFTEKGRHLVCEDTNINGHPVYRLFGKGPYEAVRDFLRTNPNWKQDNALWKRNMLSFHHHGWLQRVE
jgi:cephalosporin hydroxylase